MNRQERRSQKEALLSAERLREMLSYDSETGVFHWRFSRRGIQAKSIAGRSAGPGYWQICTDGLYFYAHRLAWLYVTGEWPENDIDHEDLNKRNNRFANLRDARKKQNQGNRPANRRTKSGVKGVRQGASGKWLARITREGKDHHLGSFDTKADAMAAYASAAAKQFGEFARTS